MFLKVYFEEHLREIPEIVEKGPQAILADSWPLHGVVGLKANQLFPVVAA